MERNGDFKSRARNRRSCTIQRSRNVGDFQVSGMCASNQHLQDQVDSCRLGRPRFRNRQLFGAKKASAAKDLENGQ